MADEKYPFDLLYHPEHDWARVDGEEARLGITWYAQDQLGDIVYWDVPAVGTTLRQGDPYTELESVKAVSDVVAPLSGEVIAVNADVAEDPTLVNRSPYDDGWLVRVRLTNPAETSALLAAGAYQELLAP
jgi:glycine cleavage system H protein